MKTRYRIQIKGLNLDNLLNILYSKKLKISNICRKKGDTHTLFLNIDKADYLGAMSDRVFDKFDVCVVQELGFLAFIKRCIAWSGAVIGLFFALGVGLVNSSKIWEIDIDIKGATDLAIYQSVMQTLEDSGVHIGSPVPAVSMYDLSQSVVLANEEISTATVEKIGTKLVVKVYLASSVYQTGDLFALRNGVVKEILVGTGTPIVNVGDVVCERDTLVRADESGNAVATVLASVFYLGTSVYDENVVSMQPTGKIQKQTTLELFGQTIGKQKATTFNYYKKKVSKDFAFNNFFLPIKVTTCEFFELQEVSKFVPFEEVEEQVKNEAKALAMQSLNSACQIVNIDYTIKREGGKVIVDCFIESLENIAG